MASIGECDSCCGQPRLLRRVMSPAGEGYFCSVCRGGSLADDIDDLEDMLFGIEEALKEARKENG